MDIIKTIASTLALTAALTLVTSCGDKSADGDKAGSGDTASGGKQVAGTVELKLDLPKPEFQGTPTPPNLPDDLPFFKGKRPKLFIPEDAVNVSKGKSVTSSEMDPIIGDLEQITDGEKGASDGNFVELGPMTQWVQIDLGAPTEINAIAIWHYHAQARVYYDVIVQVSNDADFIEGVTTLFNNDHDDSSLKGVGKDKAYTDTFDGWVVDGKATKGQYVRLYSRGNSSDEMNHYIEVEVFGKAGK